MREQEKIEHSVRLDKWLWAARFYKTRALARKMIDGGKVHYNEKRSKPSKIVETKAKITVRQGNEERTVIVLLLINQRRSASEALLAYQETEISITKRKKNALDNEMNALITLHSNHRPNKKNRRKLIKFKNFQLR